VVWLRVLVALPFGLALGSFMTVAVSRMPAGESVLRPRSRCSACGAEIRARDNVPVVSWLLLRGRCRSCGARISPAYPLIELATAAFVVGAAARYERPWQAVIVGLLVSIMPAVAVIDLRHRIIPNRLTEPGLAVALALVAVAWAVGGGTDPLRGALGLVLYGGPFVLTSLVAPSAMGMGDGKLAALIGLALGSIGLRYVGVAAGAAIVLGGLGGLFALALGRGRRSRIPFGPFIAAGAVVAAFWGERLASGYLRTIT
jgi:leader peptidase (prepilin peptidase)/N-methyltransferase